MRKKQASRYRLGRRLAIHVHFGIDTLKNILTVEQPVASAKPFGNHISDRYSFSGRAEHECLCILAILNVVHCCPVMGHQGAHISALSERTGRTYVSRNLCQWFLEFLLVILPFAVAVDCMGCRRMRYRVVNLWEPCPCKTNRPSPFILEIRIVFLAKHQGDVPAFWFWATGAAPSALTTSAGWTEVEVCVQALWHHTMTRNAYDLVASFTCSSPSLFVLRSRSGSLSP